ncbi:MAG TPA: hypothetical protein VFK23_01955 [Nitrospirota bacterium]|nr:hypothetical protein [Nitrospirota bacterium]
MKPAGRREAEWRSVEENKQTASDSQKPEKDPGYRNVLKLIILIVVLVGAWYLLEWLINGK